MLLLLGLLLGLLGCLHLAHSTLGVLTQRHSLSTGLQGNNNNSSSSNTQGGVRRSQLLPLHLSSLNPVARLSFTHVQA
jgi:hypothetical protein